MSKNQKLWTEEEIKILKEKYIQSSCREIAKLLNRTTRSVQHKFTELQLKRPKLKVGDKIGRLQIEDIIYEEKYNQQISFAICKCACGNATKTRLTAMKQGYSLSCGCLKNEKARERCVKQNYVHGKSDLKSNRLYRVWTSMKSRCYNKNSKAYIWYGAKGIKVCNKWLHNYEAFEEWSLKNGYAENLSIDRKDCNKHYCPQNCRWTTAKMQALNRTSTRRYKVFITAFGETKNVDEWEADKRCVVPVKTLFYRLGAGWSPEDVITKPSVRKQ